VAALLLTADAAPAQPLTRQFIGNWDGAVVNLVLESRPDGGMAGQVDEIWIDSAGQRKSGTADVAVIPHGDKAELFLEPQSFITLPFVLHGVLEADHASLRQIGIGAGSRTGILRRGDDIAFQRLLGDLKPATTFPLIPKATAPEPPMAEATDLDGGGCQCDAGKTTHIALDTASFATDTSHLLARVNDYILAIDATGAALADGRMTTSLPSGDVSRQADWRGYTDRVLAGRRSINAFNRILQESGLQIETGLTAAEQRCGQRQLTSGEAVTSESKLWRKTCQLVAQAHDLYRGQRTSPSGDVVAVDDDILERKTTPEAQ
jgi:hypothetical protein